MRAENPVAQGKCLNLGPSSILGVVAILKTCQQFSICLGSTRFVVRIHGWAYAAQLAQSVERVNAGLVLCSDGELVNTAD